MKFVGIDPGTNGGLAVIRTDNNGGTLGYSAWAFAHLTETDLWHEIKRIVSTAEQESVYILIERQGARPTDRPKNVAKLHHQWGVCRGMLIATQNLTGFEDISPTAWQTPMKVIMPKDTPKTVKKNKHKAKAQQLFPELKITHGISDALLIAEHARRQYLKGVACG